MDALNEAIAPQSKDAKKKLAAAKTEKRKEDQFSKAFAKARAAHPLLFEVYDDPFVRVPWLTLETIMGGGPRRGRIIEVFGPEGSGKTTLTVQLVGHDLQADEVAIFHDYEHTFTPDHVARYSGRDVVHMAEAEDWFRSHKAPRPPVILWGQPITLEDGTDAADEMIDVLAGFGARLVHLIVDSVAAMTPSAQADSGADGDLPAIRARRLGWWLEQAVHKYHAAGASIWLVNQVRDKIGAFGFSELSKITTPGGRGPKFFATHRLYVKPGYDKSWIPILGEDGGFAEIWCIKNKVSPTKRGRTRLALVAGRGFSREVEILDLCEERGVLKAAGPGLWSFNGTGPFTRASLLRAMFAPERGAALYELLRKATVEKLNHGPYWLKEYEPDASEIIPLEIPDTDPAG